ncbi:ABC transporter ATP-binding protein [Xylanimonas ulmi]|uniref:ABC-2 type transport system ATP-binding protein n=1 Tax=Xylanimonas ulmi TaxID=228973 RepID=A0A4Q7M1Y2_9MICO|nr:ATP-binding cassette domain-containing protein [Xylanibacterium ulmi]RZS60418.1 ABC-2 type transport system ATP-binding protein [Xylanibacterium ulmi]
MPITTALPQRPRTSPGPAIEVAGLTKSYRSRHGVVRALDGVDLVVEPGAVLGLLGPNGAGKSTTVRILATLSLPDAGTARVSGHDVVRDAAAVRREIGYVSQRPVTRGLDTGRENLELAGRLHGLSRHAARARAGELLDAFGLGASADRLVRTYSGGMARKLDVAVGLMHSPAVLFLDEPTTGLDPEARAELWALVSRLAADAGMSVLLTTHYLDEADHLANQVVIVDRGRVVTSGTPDALKDQLHGDGLTVDLDEADDAARAAGVAARVDGLSEVGVDGRLLRARAASGAVTLPTLLAALDAAGVRVRAAGLARPSLDDVYLHHTGHAFDTGHPRDTGSPLDTDSARLAVGA